MIGMFGDKKNNAQIIISKMKLGKEKETETVEPKKENGFIPKIAAELLTAIENKNPESIAQTLKSFIYACKEEDEMNESESEEKEVE